MSPSITASTTSTASRPKTLVFRLSSLGDVILATSFCEALPEGQKVDWVVLKEFAPILEGHPRIQTLWTFDRKTGLKGWVKLCERLSEESYDQIYDLHGSLRTRIAKQIMIKHGGAKNWLRFPKPVFKTRAYFLLKSMLPKNYRPKSYAEAYALFAGGTGNERPNLRYLLEQVSETARTRIDEILSRTHGEGIGVMPSSKWRTKSWSVEHYAELLSELPVFPIILGTQNDAESKQLCDLLSQRKIPHVSGVGRWTLAEVAYVLSKTRYYLGNDTGLSHLAEALGVKANVIFGPTAPDAGFGPSLSLSRAIGLSLWCRPCGKDGRFCIQPIEKQKCLKHLSPNEVKRQLNP